MELYIYNTETSEVMAVVTGKDNTACEDKADDLYNDDNIGWSYTDYGLIETTDTEYFDA
uniref:Uncharacterized protein n=1 Tax=viral metagenome TaxID=1070528 RepID=A0A6H1ZE84_9ZZZZ